MHECIVADNKPGQQLFVLLCFLERIMTHLNQTLETKAYLYKLLANFIISILSEPLSQHLPSRGSPDWPGCCSGSY